MIVSGIMESELSNITDVWVFGYGSILWNPGFDYVSSCVGYVEGYSRRFYQGSVFHRGTPDKPGRVATLIQHSGCKAWGMAFHVVGKSMVENCLEHLGVRECHIGGYQLQSLQFIQHSSTGTGSSDVTADHFCLPAWAFIAVPGNQLYLGPATIEQQAKQVCECRGVSGCNTEYVTKLADFLRDKIPQDNDSELFKLDRRVREIQQQQQQQHHHHHHHHTADSHVKFNDISKITNSSLSNNAMATVAPTISVRAC